MSFTAKINKLRKILGEEDHFQREKALSSLSWLSVFNDVLLFDASPIRLPKRLSDKYPGNRKNHSPACFKLSALFSLSTKSAKWIQLSPQKSHDSKFLPDLNRMFHDFKTITLHITI